MCERERERNIKQECFSNGEYNGQDTILSEEGGKPPTTVITLFKSRTRMFRHLVLLLSLFLPMLSLMKVRRGSRVLMDDYENKNETDDVQTQTMMMTVTGRER